MLGCCVSKGVFFTKAENKLKPIDRHFLRYCSGPGPRRQLTAHNVYHLRATPPSVVPDSIPLDHKCRLKQQMKTHQTSRYLENRSLKNPHA